MGFDLFGVTPTSVQGQRFRNNVWYWRPLADYVVQQCCIDPNGWFHNGGHSVSEEQARAIAAMLDRLLSSGQVKAYEADYTERLAKLPDEQCDICVGTGVRSDEIVCGTCNACRGKGSVPAWARNYPFSEENVREFAEFCRYSGGFTIN
jgi:hypothetical protein